MLDILTDGFKNAVQKFNGKATLTEEVVDSAIKDIRKSLLEADVEYGVAKRFLKSVKDKTLGEEVKLKAGKGSQALKVTPQDHFVKICKEELEGLMGPIDTDLELPKNRPASIMMVGLQGTGKTTSTGKIAKYLMTKHQRKPMLVAADIYRPAAVEQLKVLAKKIGVPCHHIEGANPVEICQKANAKALELDCDAIIYDTAGRLSIDKELMDELSDIKSTCKPDNILLVCDSMMGQDAVTTAENFNKTLGLSGIIMTKLDGDSRGGAALSIKEVTGAPIKFLGMGEDLDRLEVFRPEGLASRILGMGDIVGLMDDFERVADKDQEQDAMRMLSGQFNFKDFYQQISMIQKMGSLKDLMAKLPMQNMIPKDAQVDEKELHRIKAMIDSMTEKERLMPDLINESRARRIALGSGRKVSDVQGLLKKFKGMRTMMGSLGKNLGGGMFGKLPGMGSLSKMNQMRKMASAMGGGGGMPDLDAMMGGMPGMPGFPGGAMGQAAAPMKRTDRDKIKKARKSAKSSRKKNRKR